MQTVTHKKENMKDEKEREKCEIEYAPYCFQVQKARHAEEYGADAISTFGLVMLYLQQIILKLLPYQKQFFQ